MPNSSTQTPFWMILLGGLILAGCGGGDREQPAASADAGPGTSTLPADSANGTPKTASIEAPQAATAPPEQGTPAWYLQQIKQVRLQTAPEGASLEQLRQFRRERNEDIVDLATQVIAATHDAPEQNAAFNSAVEELLEARLQVALQGNTDDIDLLYADAESLANRDSKSTAAMLASYTLVRFAHTNAQRFGQKEKRWLDEFSRQARQFAAAFPGESTRSIPLLTAAAMTCELHGHLDEARLCHTLLAEQFPDSPQGRFSVGVLRRLGLVGQLLEFAGPTQEGDFITIDDFANRVLLIVFWSSDDEEFTEQVPQLKALYEKYHSHGLDVVGVCLDEDETELNTWLDENPLPWRQIFCADKSQRRWDNPIVQYYGVRDIPAFWLVDHEGRVVSTTLEPATLENPLREKLLALRAALKPETSNATP